MQKKIIALAIAAAFSAPVVAMADVTMYGTMDGGVRHQTNDKAAAGTTDTMQMGQYNTARFGFKGVDDIDGGMKATVILETSLAPGGVGSNPFTQTSATTAQVAADGNASNPFGLLFDRQATIGLAGGWGSFDMGWNYTTSFSVIKTFDPFDYKFLPYAGAKTSDLMRFDAFGVARNQDRAGNMIYKNKFGDVTVQLEYDVNNGDKASPAQGGVGRAIGLTYASGPVNVGFAYTAVEPDAAAGFDNGTTHMTAGAGFNFGDGKVSVGYAKNTIKTPVGSASDDINTNMWAGVSFNMSSKMAVTAAMYKKTNTSMMQAASVATGTAGTSYGVAGLPNANSLETNSTISMIALTYNLSKATTAYVEFDKKNSTGLNTAGTALGAETIATGTSLGLNTSF